MSAAEEWRWIPGYEGRYEVSNQGRVRSWVGRYGARRTTAYYFKCGPNAVGYPAIQFRDQENRVRTYAVHRLVLAAFIGSCPPGQEVRHLNGDRTDNRLTNLQYGTHSENVRDSISHGTHPHARKTHCYRGHEFSADNTRITPGGSRECRTCCNARSRKFFATKRANRDPVVR